MLMTKITADTLQILEPFKLQCDKSGCRCLLRQIVNFLKINQQNFLIITSPGTILNCIILLMITDYKIK